MPDKEPKLPDPEHELNPDVYRAPGAEIEPAPEDINPPPAPVPAPQAVEPKEPTDGKH